MAVFDLAIGDLTVNDIEAGLKLSDEAGWNQIGDDWRLFITCGRTVGVRTEDGELVGSAAALPHAKEFGFIAMVLVTAAWRRRGLATKLVDICLERIRGWGLTPMLDATPAGALVYRRQGFAPLFDLDRWQGLAGSAHSASETPIREAGAADLSDLVAIDARAIGAERGFLIEDFYARAETRAVLAERRDGFAMIRRGRRAWQIGPIVASSPGEAIQLLAQVLGLARGAVFLDVPAVWKEIGDWLAGRGFTKQRGFTRMAYRRTTPFGQPEILFASAGPEFG